MGSIFISLLALSAILTDIYFYRRAFKRGASRRWLNTLIIISFLISLVALISIYNYRSLVKIDSLLVTHSVSWIMGVFALVQIPKMLFFLFSLLDVFIRAIFKRKFRFFRYIGILVAVFAFTQMLWGLSYGRTRFRVERVEVSSEKLPEVFDGMRIAVFSDVHLEALEAREKFLNRMVDSINTLDADIVVQAGDIIHRKTSELDSTTMSILSRIKSRYGTYSVLGNHDLGFYIPDTTKVSISKNMRDLIACQQDMGWHLLINQSDYIVSGSDTITISGINYPSDDHSLSSFYQTNAGADINACYIGLDQKFFNIMLSHNPRMWNEILDCSPADLTIAGHIHAMQMKFGFGKHKWSPAALIYPHWSGLYEQNNRYLYVNDGVGYVFYPMRINVLPEITLITLRKR